ncbi:peptidase inhibitor family I36 protein [Streptomyces sp. NPDC059783]|uniref:peptidase inhibitor family I36 protein n=1 Tax=Streptomyces sp. NPDC059783 TaxID=3346944 RepID=UPI00364EE703
MTLQNRRRARLVRVTALVASAVGGAVLSLGATTAQAATPGSTPASAVRAALPPGVVPLNDSEPCPSATLCLYRDYGNRGPAYGIGAGYNVNLRDLPMAGGGTAADNVSSWVNNTDSVALLLDENGPARPVFPGQHLQEPPELNDSVDLVVWP